MESKEFISEEHIWETSYYEKNLRIREVKFSSIDGFPKDTNQLIEFIQGNTVGACVPDILEIGPVGFRIVALGVLESLDSRYLRTMNRSFNGNNIWVLCFHGVYFRCEPSLACNVIKIYYKVEKV